MHDPWNPTADEVREWAYDPDSLAPCEDWDLALGWAQHERTYLQLASDESCPKRRYFLIVGDAVRAGFRNRARPIVKGLISLGDEYDHPDIRKWQERSRDLLKHPERFDYESWCGGKLAGR